MAHPLALARVSLTDPMFKLCMTARAQWILAVREHWCAGEVEYYGLRFWLIGDHVDLAGAPDLQYAASCAERVAKECGY